MKLLIDISDDIFTRLFDVGTEGMNVEDRIEVGKAIRKGVPPNKIIDKINEEMTFWELGGNTELVVYGMKQALGIIEEYMGVME